MAASLSLTEAQIMTVLKSFLATIMPSGVVIRQGQQNRISEPKGTDYIIMLSTLRERLAFNVDHSEEAAIIGSITGTTLTVTSVRSGVVQVGQWLTASGIIGFFVIGQSPIGSLGSVMITAFGTGTGGVGTYVLDTPQHLDSAPIFAGSTSAMGAMKLTVQLDIHGPNSTDNAQIIATLFRDDYACQFFSDSGYDVQPLYPSEPKQIPFISGESQYEYRWIVEAVLQANPVVTTPQQFAGSVQIDLVNVEAAYPVGD